MLDQRLLRNNLEEVKQRLETRNLISYLDDFVELDQLRRDIIGQVEELKGIVITSQS